MGDRANIVIPQEKKGVSIYLYTHWGGSSLPATLQKALARRQRWDDLSYLTRIIFCEMIAGQEKEETGYGISTYPPDNDGYPYLIVDVKNKHVIVQPTKWTEDKGTVHDPDKQTHICTFEWFASRDAPITWHQLLPAEYPDE